MGPRRSAVDWVDDGVAGVVDKEQQDAGAPMLRVDDHRRDAVGLTYVYPVVSRRAGGVSVGINLNVNNACNWACIYCQVPNLTRGGPPPVDLVLLRSEFAGFLGDLLDGDYLCRHVPEDVRRIADVAFSGNGEPTTAAEFDATVAVVVEEMTRRGLAGEVPLRLITNGSQLHRPVVREGIRRLGAVDGEVWFKVDRGSAAGMATVNQIALSPERVLANLRECAALAPTWVQTCWFAVDGVLPDADETAAYLQLLQEAGTAIRGVHLYGIARPSLQPGAEHLGRLDAQALEDLAGRIRACGIRVNVNP